jgi:hypothetical protein
MVVFTRRTVPFAIALVVLGYFVLESRVRPLWEDEILTYRLSTAHTWSEFVSVSSSLEANPPTYYVINRCIVSFLGTSDTCLRLQSLLWGLAFIALTWKLGNRYFDSCSSLFALVAVTISSSFMYYVTEARPYTLLCFSVALALFVSSQWTLTASNSRLLPVSFMVFAFLASSHTFGVLYGGLIVAGIAMVSIREKRHWKLQAVCSLAGLGTVAFWVPNMLSTASATRSWIPVPSFTAGYRQLQLQIDFQPYVICLIAVCLIGWFRCRDVSFCETLIPNQSSQAMALLVPACACLLILPLVFIESHLFRPMFWPRYFIGLSIVYFVFLGMLSTSVVHASSFHAIRKEFRWAVAGVFFLLSLLSAVPGLGNRALYARGPTAAEMLRNWQPIEWVKTPLVDTRLMTGTPVVFTSEPFHARVSYYAKEISRRQLFLVDFREIVGLRDRGQALKQIAGQVGFLDASEAEKQILIFSEIGQALDSSAFTDDCRLTYVGIATLPYLGDVASVYLLRVPAKGSATK